MLIPLSFYVSENVARLRLSSRILSSARGTTEKSVRVSYTKVLAKSGEKHTQPQQVQSLQEVCSESTKLMARLQVQKRVSGYIQIGFFLKYSGLFLARNLITRKSSFTLKQYFCYLEVIFRQFPLSITFVELLHNLNYFWFPVRKIRIKRESTVYQIWWDLNSCRRICTPHRAPLYHGVVKVFGIWDRRINLL